MSLSFVEAPALAPPEIELDPESIKQYEQELEIAQNCALPDDDEDL